MSISRGLSFITQPIKSAFSSDTPELSAAKTARAAAGLSTTGYVHSKALSKKQDKLLKKALKKMGLSQDEMFEVSYNLEGSARTTIETALKRAAKMQDGGGDN